MYFINIFINKYFVHYIQKRLTSLVSIVALLSLHRLIFCNTISGKLRLLHIWPDTEYKDEGSRREGLERSQLQSVINGRTLSVTLALSE